MLPDYPIDVVIPALNEEESLPKVLTALRALNLDSLREVIVVDNGSRDRTAEVAARHGATVLREPRPGYGGACLRGIDHIETLHSPRLNDDFATREKASATSDSIVVFLDADYSDYPDDLPRLLDAIVLDDMDFVVGSRLIDAQARVAGCESPQGHRAQVEIFTHTSVHSPGVGAG